MDGWMQELRRPTLHAVSPCAPVTVGGRRLHVQDDLTLTLSLAPRTETSTLLYNYLQVVAAGFTPMMTPDLVRESVFEKCGFQPRAQNTQVRPGSCGGLRPACGWCTAPCIAWLAMLLMCTGCLTAPASNSVPSLHHSLADLQREGQRDVPDGHRGNPAGRRVHGQDPGREPAAHEDGCLRALLPNRGRRRGVGCVRLACCPQGWLLVACRLLAPCQQANNCRPGCCMAVGRRRELAQPSTAPAALQPPQPLVPACLQPPRGCTVSTSSARCVPAFALCVGSPSRAIRFSAAAFGTAPWSTQHCLGGPPASTVDL